MTHIPFDTFAQCDLRVVRIQSAKRVEGSEKLLKLTVDLGDESRQIVAGIGRAYEPEDLIGRMILIIANLEPRSLMGIESQGMVLAAGAEQPVLLTPDRAVDPGSKIR
jgi:methionine--tRNA ligase beta chain